MNSTFLSQRHLHDITVLRGHDVTLRPWEMKLGDHLAGFADAIDLCTTINATFSDDGMNFGLADAAYVLNSAGLLWSKRVDGLVRTARTTMDALSDLDRCKQGKKPLGEKENEKPRKRAGHPLALGLGDAVKGKRNFIPKREGEGRLAGVVKELPRLTVEAYLLQTQPHSLPLLACERICSYSDDRGNKALDWAEFRVNTIKMTRDGFYPLGGSTNLPDNRDVDEVMEGEDGGSVGGLGDDEQVVNDDTVTDMHTIPLTEAQQEISQYVKERSKRPSRSVPSTAAFLPPTHNEPFQKAIHIGAVLTERRLKCDVVQGGVRVVEEEVKAFCRRKKRVMKEKEVAAVSGEVSFFLHFWDIFAPHAQPKILLKAVMDRYKWRLKQVEVTVKEKRKGRRVKVEKTTQFVSMNDTHGDGDGDNDGEEGESESEGDDEEGEGDGEGTGQVEVGEGVESQKEEDATMTDADNYIELDEPIGDENALQLDAETDFFARMIKDPRRRLSVFPTSDHLTHMNSMNVMNEVNGVNEMNGVNEDVVEGEGSFSLPVDLHEWEGKLGDFLKEHEAATASFDLEMYGHNIVQQHKTKFGDGVGRASDMMTLRHSSSDVCRTFLSMLDLANKNLIHFEHFEHFEHLEGDGVDSQDFNHVEILVKVP